MIYHLSLYMDREFIKGDYIIVLKNLYYSKDLSIGDKGIVTDILNNKLIRIDLDGEIYWVSDKNIELDKKRIRKEKLDIINDI